MRAICRRNVVDSDGRVNSVQFTRTNRLWSCVLSCGPFAPSPTFGSRLPTSVNIPQVTVQADLSPDLFPDNAKPDIRVRMFIFTRTHDVNTAWVSPLSASDGRSFYHYENTAPVATHAYVDGVAYSAGPRAAPFGRFSEALNEGLGTQGEVFSKRTVAANDAMRYLEEEFHVPPVVDPETEEEKTQAEWMAELQEAVQEIREKDKKVHALQAASGPVASSVLSNAASTVWRDFGESPYGADTFFRHVQPNASDIRVLRTLQFDMKKHKVEKYFYAPVKKVFELSEPYSDSIEGHVGPLNLHVNRDQVTHPPQGRQMLMFAMVVDGVPDIYHQDVTVAGDHSATPKVEKKAFCPSVDVNLRFFIHWNTPGSSR
jgi:hypothetical protein